MDYNYYQFYYLSSLLDSLKHFSEFPTFIHTLIHGLKCNIITQTHSHTDTQH